MELTPNEAVIIARVRRGYGKRRTTGWIIGLVLTFSAVASVSAFSLVVVRALHSHGLSALDLLGAIMGATHPSGVNIGTLFVGTFLSAAFAAGFAFEAGCLAVSRQQTAERRILLRLLDETGYEEGKRF
jgi:hypothetical protein